jgi:hypothetical protein
MVIDLWSGTAGKQMFNISLVLEVLNGYEKKTAARLQPIADEIGWKIKKGGIVEKTHTKKDKKIFKEKTINELKTFFKDSDTSDGLKADIEQHFKIKLD